MKYAKEICIILGITFISECLNRLLPLPVPAGVYGLFILLFGLCSGWIDLDKVESSGNFLLETMPMMFIPAAVGLINIQDEIKHVILPLIIMTFVSTVFVMAVTGKVTDLVLKHHEKGKKGA